ncbi:MAG TPA: FHA domain-containing protein [bacterium]|nr:FHA domain-containing protein [bacterium]
MKLVIVDGPERGKEWPLPDGEVVLGRTNETEIELPSNKVSRKHAALRIVDGQVEIEDLGSSNGTYLNGKRITRSAVPPGGKIGVGEYLLTVVNGEKPRAATGKTGARPGGTGKQARGNAVMVVAQPGQQARGAGPRGRTGAQRNVSVPSESAQRAADEVVGRMGMFAWRVQVYLIVAMMALAGFGAMFFAIRRGQQDYASVAFARARLLAQQLASQNSDYIANKETLLLNIDNTLKETGVQEAYLTDASGKILMPSTMRGLRSDNPTALRALKRDDFETESDQVPGGFVHIAAPILHWNRDTGHFDMVGSAYIVYAPKEVAKRATPPLLLYGIAFLGIALAGAVGSTLLIRATERPIQRLQEDTELIIRGDLQKVAATTKMKELEDLAHSITRLYEKGPANSPNLASSSAFTPAQPSGALALPMQAGPVDNAGASATVRALVTAIEDAAIVVDADMKVMEVNAAAERMFGLIPARVRGQHLLEAITEKDLLNEVLDLLNEIAASPGGAITRDVNVPDGEGGTTRGHVSAAGVRQGRELAGSAIIISSRGG